MTKLSNENDKLFEKKPIYIFKETDLYDGIVDKIKPALEICKGIKTEVGYFKFPFILWIETGFLEYDTQEHKFINIYFRGKTFHYSNFEEYIKLLNS